MIPWETVTLLVASVSIVFSSLLGIVAAPNHRQGRMKTVWTSYSTRSAD